MFFVNLVHDNREVSLTPTVLPGHQKTQEPKTKTLALEKHEDFREGMLLAFIKNRIPKHWGSLIRSN